MDVGGAPGRKDSVRTRLERSDSGLSYTEFSYMLLQAYDFVHLYDAYGCEIQAGGVRGSSKSSITRSSLSIIFIVSPSLPETTLLEPNARAA